MRIYVIYILLIFNPVLTYGNNFQDGNRYFEEENYELAISSYEKEISANKSNFSAHYNLGLAYFKTKNYPLSIWAFEVAYKLNPTDINTSKALETVYHESKINTKYKPPLSRVELMICSKNSTYWAVFSIVFSTMIFVLILLVKVKFTQKFRTIIYGGITLSVFLLFFGLYAGYTSIDFHQLRNEVIVVKESNAVPVGTKLFNVKQLKNGELIGVTKNGKELTISAKATRRI